MSNITVTHAESGLVRAEVIRARRVTPHMIRVTIGGPDLDRYEHLGFDQWFRLALPIRGTGSLDRMPAKFNIGGFVRYLMLPKGTRPIVRNYTVRAFRREERELDIDFVSHGDEGIAGPWAAGVEPGERVAFIDQGRGWRDVDSDWSLIVADESALPAAAGILRDMPRDANGHAIIELFDERDRQEVDAPEGMTVHWLARDPSEKPGTLALPALRELGFPDGTPYAFLVGEQSLAVGARRHLVRERGIPRQQVTFSGYWRIGQASPS
ncbi:MAG: siderophore-interacting protein [Microbacterium sp.]